MQLAMSPIETERLLLVPLSLADAASMVNGHVPPGARWTVGYPTERTLVRALMVLTAHDQGHDPGPFTGYQVVRRDDGTVLGDCGFDAPPDGEGTVHVGVGIAFSERHRGYASEALRAVIDWARDRPEVTRVRADAHRGNFETIRDLERAGMRRVGRDERLIHYEA